MRSWYLEGLVEGSKTMRRFTIDRFPFRVGRQEGLPLRLESSGISRVHAEIVQNNKGLLLRDLKSTNGTYLNGERIDGEVRVRAGDIIHFASVEFRLASEDRVTRVGNFETQQGISSLSQDLPQGTREVQEMLLTGRTTAVFQPILEADGETVYAYEILGRGAHEDLPESPAELFRIAESVNLEGHLSELFRSKGVSIAEKANPSNKYFFNIHPHEAEQPDRLMEKLEQLRHEHPSMDLVLEVHEGAVTDPKIMQNIKDRLRELDMGLAYDDFGAGQARLVELVEVPPDFVKFDMSLVRNIHEASKDKQEMVGMLVKFVRDRGIRVVAEGIDCPEEAEVCSALGFDLVQGFHFGRPGPLEPA